MELAYTVKRSAKRRKLTITVERDKRVVVHAPAGVSDERVREVVESKRLWLYEKLGHGRKYREAPHPPGKELVNGESALYLGREYRIEVVKAGLDEVRFAQRFQIPAGREGALRDWYMGRAKEKIVPRVRRYARQMGVEVAAVKVVDNRYRWGSCTEKSNINLNWRLIKAPMFVVDYVIVHELAHLMEPAHTPRFWNIVRVQAPRSEEAREWLREHGQLLEEEI